MQDFGQEHNRELSRRGSHRRRDGHPRDDPVYYFCPLCISTNNDNNNFLCKIKFCENYVPDFTYYPYDNNNKIKTDLNLYSNHYPTSSDSKYPSQSYTKHKKFKSSYSKCIGSIKTTTKGGSYKFGNDLRNFVKNQRSGVMIKTLNNSSNRKQVKHKISSYKVVASDLSDLNDLGVGVNRRKKTAWNQSSSCRVAASDLGEGVNQGLRGTRDRSPTYDTDACNSGVGLTADNSSVRVRGNGGERKAYNNMLEINSSSSSNLNISKDHNNNNTYNNYNKNFDVVRDSQSLSRHNSGHPDQSSRFKNRINSYLHNHYGEVRPDSHGEQGGVGQLQPHPYRVGPDHVDQEPTGNHDNEEWEEIGTTSTPKRQGMVKHSRRLFNESIVSEEEINVVPLDTDLEILLINSGQINAVKVQTIINEFMTNNKHSTIFCMTETKVRGHNFQPIGIKMFVKHRELKDKKGGGLALGYEEKANIRMEEIKTGSTDILGIEGRIYNKKCRIILCYFDCTKQLSGVDYERNRSIQTKVENLLEVDPDTYLMVLGDLNGRLVELEPNIKSDANGEMIRSWVEKKNLIHLNAMDTCKGKYTFKTVNGKSAIDHVLVNENMRQKHLNMWVDEDKTMLDISDHNLVRVWFKMGNNNYRGGKRNLEKE